MSCYYQDKCPSHSILTLFEETRMYHNNRKETTKHTKNAIASLPLRVVRVISGQLPLISRRTKDFKLLH